MYIIKYCHDYQIGTLWNLVFQFLNTFLTSFQKNQNRKRFDEKLAWESPKAIDKMANEFFISFFNFSLHNLINYGSWE